MLTTRPEPKVSVIHQEFSPVLLRRDRVIVNLLKNFSCYYVDLITARSATIRAHGAFDYHGRFLAQSLERIPDFFANRALHGDTLDNAGSIAQLRKSNLPARAHVVEPSF